MDYLSFNPKFKVMNLNPLFCCTDKQKGISKMLKIMKLSTFILLVSCLQVAASVNSQTVSISQKNTSLQKIFKEMNRQTGYQFFYKDNLLNQAGKVDLIVSNVPIEEALNICFKNLPITYGIVDNIIVVKAKEKKVETIITPIEVTPLISAPSIVKGFVTDADGKGLQSVSVLINGTKQGVTTDINGQFVINAKVGDQLVFSYVGYINQTVTIQKEGAIINIKLAASKTDLNDVVVVGYGVQKKVSMTSAVSQIKSEEITRRPVSNLQQALQGQAPGLTVLDRGGEPGRTTATMRIRGITTFSGNSSANSSPLIIIDGVEQTFFNLNPEDVETVSVLKDASSTAIYGSRAANGVILVTTKRGKTGQVKVSYNGFYASQRSMNSPEMMEGEAFMRYEQLACLNAGIAIPTRYTDANILAWVNATDREKYPLPNTWFQTVLKPAPQFSHNFSFSGGNEFSKTRISFRTTGQGGIAPNHEASIRELRVNNDLKISNKLKLSTDLNYRYNYSSKPYSTDVFNRFLHGTLWAVPKYADGTYGLSPQNSNPLMLAEMSGYDKISTNYLYSTAKLDYEIIKDLTFTAQISGVFNYQEQKSFQNAYSNTDKNTGGVFSVANNTLNENRTRYYELTSNYLLNYHKSINKHDFKTLLGYSEIYNNGNSVSAYRERFYNNDIQSLGQGASDATRNNGGSDYEYGLKSAFARINYSFDEKYLLEVNGRYDGSSRFASENQYSFFPSFSGAWRMTKESFFEKMHLPFNELKLRGSWGKTGNQTVPLYSYYSSLTQGSYTFNGAAATTFSATSLADRTITWETNTQTDIGIEGELLKNKLSFSVDYYKKTTEGILLALPLPTVIGFTSSNQNAGTIENKGWEFMLGYKNADHKVHYAFTGNFAISENKVLDLKGSGPFISGSDIDPRYIVAVGLPFNAHWGYKTAGYFQTAAEISSYPTILTGTKPGDVKYVDLNNDGKINADDMTMIGNPFPKFTFGLNSEVSYKSFALNFFLQGAAQVDTRLSGALSEIGIFEGFATKLVTNNYWTPTNTNAYFPLPRKSDGRNVNTSDRMILDGSYLRLKNLQLTYNVPASICKKLSINGVKIYTSATNLLTFSKLNEWGLDPEIESGRGTYYPQTRTITFGANINF
jgi:TonB-linked SusC/RagA family outer membrane protein